MRYTLHLRDVQKWLRRLGLEVAVALRAQQKPVLGVVQRFDTDIDETFGTSLLKRLERHCTRLE